MAVQNNKTVSKWKCPCDYQLDSDYFQRNIITSEHLNEMSRKHYASGWHKLTKMFGCSAVDKCSYCADPRKSSVFIVKLCEKGNNVYKCDACFHLGADKLPKDDGYAESWGNTIRQLKDEARKYKSPTPKRKQDDIDALLSPEPSEKRPYGIQWTNVQYALRQMTKANPP